MLLLKTDWQFFSDLKFNNIRDNNFTIIYSNEGDYSTAKKVYRSREMYDLIEKLLISAKAGIPIEPILKEMELLKKDIDKLN